MRAHLHPGHSRLPLRQFHRANTGRLHHRRVGHIVVKRNIRTISIYCAKCQTLLYKYHKGGSGGLVKCLVERIVEDRTAGDLKCPACEQEFARLQMIGNRPAHKIIQGKVFTKGMRRK